jgi:tetratricopeptide (TPR) repeat protein
MSDDLYWNDDYQIEGLASRFESMIQGGEGEYFDAEEFEILIDYYQHSFNTDKSRLALDIAMQQHPFSSGLKIKQARQLATENNFLMALDILTDLELSEPNNPEIIMTRGTIYSMMMEFKKAIEEYKNALQLVDEEELEDIYSTIAFEYENLGQYGDALIFLKKALSKSPESEPLLFEIGLCYEVDQRLADAVFFFNSHLEKYPYSLAAWFNLGLAYQHLEQYEKAIDSFEYVLAIDHKYMAAYMSMGQAYAGLENYTKAIEVYRESFEIEKPEALTYYNIGECYEKMQDYRPALINYRKAIDLDEELADPWAGIGVIFDEEGNTKTAVRYLENACQLDPLNTEFLLILAELYIKSEAYDKATSCFIKMEEIDPSDPYLWVEHANMYVVKGEYETAVNLLKTGLVNQPESSIILYRLVASLIYNKNTVQACYYLESALEIDYEGHKELLEYFPDVIHEPKIVDLIRSYHLHR